MTIHHHIYPHSNDCEGGMYSLAHKKPSINEKKIMHSPLKSTQVQNPLLSYKMQNVSID